MNSFKVFTSVFMNFFPLRLPKIYDTEKKVKLELKQTNEVNVS